MQKRLKSLQRLLAVQKDMHRLAEWRFATLERQLADLDKERRRLVSCLDSDRLFALAYTRTIVERLRVLEETEQRIMQLREEQRLVLLQNARQMGQIAQAAESAAGQCRRSEEKRDLDAAIDAALHRQRASFP